MTPVEHAEAAINALSDGGIPLGLRLKCSIVSVVMKAVQEERDRCLKLVENSYCECQEPDENGVIRCKDGCYDAICCLSWIEKKIRSGGT